MLLLLPVSSCSFLVLRLTLPWVEAGGGRVGRAGHATVAAVTTTSVVAVVIITVVVVIFAAVGAPDFVLIFPVVIVRGVLSVLATRLRGGSCSRKTSVRIY